MSAPENVEFWVRGTPVPQGSMRHVGGGRIIHSNKGLKEWREALTGKATRIKRDVGVFEDGPLHLSVTFYLPHGKQKDPYPMRRNDLDKLLRAVGDALTDSGLIVDDSRIVSGHQEKHWAVDGAGAYIRLRRKGE